MQLILIFRLNHVFSRRLGQRVQCGLCIKSYYGECVRRLNVRIGKHIGISPLTKKNVKPKSSAVSDMLLCNHSPSFENFSVLTKENKKFLLE